MARAADVQAPEAQAVWEGIVGFAEGNLLEKVVVKSLDKSYTK
jgi:hypothetical protein